MRKREPEPVVYAITNNDGALYIGATTDLAKRLVAHNGRTGSRFTREEGGYWRVVHVQRAASMVEARCIENYWTTLLADLGTLPFLDFRPRRFPVSCPDHLMRRHGADWFVQRVAVTAWKADNARDDRVKRDAAVVAGAARKARDQQMREAIRAFRVRRSLGVVVSGPVCSVPWLPAPPGPFVSLAFLIWRVRRRMEVLHAAGEVATARVGGGVDGRGVAACEFAAANGAYAADVDEAGSSVGRRPAMGRW